MAGPQQYYVPPPPPPPPPGFGEGMGSRPTSGMAIASLILGLVGLIGVFCWFPVIGSLVGVIMGIVAIGQTGKNGKRSGRGLAIAGTIVSALAIVAMVAWVGAWFYLIDKAGEEVERSMAAQTEADQKLILERLKAYYDANEQSLGPGGPVLAQNSTSSYDGTYRSQPANTALPDNTAPAVDTRPRVAGALTLKDLVGEHELSFGTRSGGGMGWELTISGKASASLRATDWSGNVVREVDIRDIGRNQIVQVK